MPETAAHQGSGNFRDDHGLLPGLLLESDYIPAERLCPGMPGHIQKTEAQLTAAGVSYVEISGVYQFLY